MRVAIAGAGAVGRSIAQDLAAAGNAVLIIEHVRAHYRPDLVPAADWMLADACELASLQAAGIDTCDAVVAAAGEDRTNLVFAMLAKTEFGVRRVVARVNDPRNQWLFTPGWGVDVAVSTPSALVAAVESQIPAGGDVVTLAITQRGGTLVELTVPESAALVGQPSTGLPFPPEATLVAVRRDQALLPPSPELTLESGDWLLVLTSGDADEQIRALVRAQVSS